MRSTGSARQVHTQKISKQDFPDLAAHIDSTNTRLVIPKACSDAEF